MAEIKDDWPDWAKQHYLHTWQPIIRRRALASRVLVVATTRIEGTWTAYCDAVPGENHDLEQQRVLEVGDTVPEPIARALFPDFDFLPYHV